MSDWWNLSKTAAQTAVFWTVFLAILPWAIHSLETSSGLANFASNLGWRSGGALLIGASCLGLWSGYTMAKEGHGTPLPLDCPRRLVTDGPYAYVRNPMAIAGLSQGAAVGVMIGSWGVLAYVAIGAVIWHLGVRPLEEAHLAEMFGNQYTSYRRSVRCWAPRLSPYTPDGA
ncbi:hypothetical protein MalM25_01030 [Planctomycetes bacterium MalM25]|nr:hypothetical protein MalM25_01030 [Planctomycetes bacterium MalM25]